MPLISAALAIACFGRPSMAGATRDDHDGWTYVRLSGTPREIGYQYGTLLWKEIDENQKIIQRKMRKSTDHDWKFFRAAAREMFWSKIGTEIQEELQGQADALKAKGLPYDVDDVLTMNAYIELEGYFLPWKLKEDRSGATLSCSAFVAVGSATKDGKVVMAHNFWWDYLTGQRFNVMVDITPKKGHRVMFDAIAGFIHSGTDWGINDVGIMITETTISGFTGFDPKGIPEFARMRNALQFGASLDDVARIFRQGNNGGYANTWLLADTQRNEIGKLQLGLKNVVFSTSSNGAFYGANYPEDEKLRVEECKYYSTDPQGNCEMRRARWKELIGQNSGKVDAEMAKAFLADDMLDSRSPYGGGTCNSKVATTEMVAEWQVWGRMGFSNGTAMSMANARKREPMLRDIPAQNWSLLGGK